MADFTLFPKDKIVGVFRGFREGGLEFHADLVLPYRSEFQRIPMHGQFLLVQLETPDEAVLGRITSFSSEGKLSFGVGEEFNLRAVQEDRPIPEDLREQYLKYKVNIRVLGVLRSTANKLTFVPSQRRLPHVGSPTAFASDPVLQEIAGHNLPGAPIGHLALGEYVYAQGSPDLTPEEWMQIKSPEVLVKFPVENLVSRRSFIFARAGFGKSNLNKLLFSKLYAQTPTVTKRAGRQVPVGTIIFDPDGEYFWPDDKGRPGLCDVPELEDKLVVFTSRRSPSSFYQSFVAGGIKLDLRQLSPSDVIAIALSPERQEQQNVRKLRALNPQKWSQLVDLVDDNGNQADLGAVCKLLDLDKTQEVEALAARANMAVIVKMLHDKKSQLMDLLLKALSMGKLCVVDVSQMRGGQSLMLSGLILRKIFDHNQQEFTSADSKTIPTIAVVEEAQSVLNDNSSASEPYIAWIKEGRKYDLGALLITQQPGSIPVEILSQGDNWFIFHLLSANDLYNVQKANAHFSQDLLSVLLNEPIPGHGIYWSSVGGKPYPVSLRVLSFEQHYKVRDPDYNKAAAPTFAIKLRKEAENQLYQAVFNASADNNRSINSHSSHVDYAPGTNKINSDSEEGQGQERKGSLRSHNNDSESGNDSDNDKNKQDGNFQLEKEKELEMLLNTDPLALYRQICIETLKKDESRMRRLNSEEGLLYGNLIPLFKEMLPSNIADLDNLAYNLIPEVLERVFGARNEKWETYKKPGREGKPSTYIRRITG